MNEEEEEAEIMADASIDQRQVHGILNWLQMPNSWFRPTAAALDPSGARSKFREEADLFAPRTTHSFIFIDDLGLNVMGEVEAQEEFVRFLLDHRVAFSRKEGKVLPLEKQVGAAMRVDDAMITGERCPSGLIRLIRHFIVLQVPSYDRNQLLSVFRIKYQTYFQNHGASSVKSGENQSSQQHRSDRLLSIEETALRANVDLAIELSGIQQAVDKTSAANVSLFIFNLHHMSALLERTLAFGASMQAHDASTTLLKLGKLHQAWMSEIRNTFLVNYPSSGKRPSINATKPARGSPRSQTDAVRREWLQKVWITLRLISEKYFSVSLREDNSALASTEVVYFTLRLAAKYSQLSVVEQLKRLREIMTTNASASSLTVSIVSAVAIVVSTSALL
uniref:Uncharacterized protein n=1 Tax=Globisporangium ultimum (strain ATCC 200006 / CBS 805.95 / DAOM BR144) TaxID=431595 RepID=K3WX14_GLOUD